MKVHWTDNAEHHLDAIYDYLAQNSSEYAKIVIDRLTCRSKQISAFPLSGHIVPEFDIEQIREVKEGPYRIIYFIKSDQIDIIAVIHSAMNILKEENS
jgi:plasmid stabilization system protein ParE